MKKLFLLIGFTLLILSCNQREKDPVESASSNSPESGHRANISVEKKDVNIESDEGSLSIAEILADREKYSGEIVTVKGEVTKFNPAILQKNWVHIQDGTEFSGDFDLTITTEEVISVGAVVTFRGKIVLDKDFGYGYVYSTLMEEGQIVK